VSDEQNNTGPLGGPVKIAMIAIKHKTFELDKPGWIAALMDVAHKRKERKMHYG